MKNTLLPKDSKRITRFNLSSRYILFNQKKQLRSRELVLANRKIAIQRQEKGKRSNELMLANWLLKFKNNEREQRAAELVIANEELAIQNIEKEKRAAELILANTELQFQNQEKENRAAELVVANKELAFQNEEKENRAAELALANTELLFQNQEKEKRAAELVVANNELAFQNAEKGKRAQELGIANEELAFQNQEKENRAAELALANNELRFQNQEKENRASELVIANHELAFQNEEKEKRAAELVLANRELHFQNQEKENRASELGVANHELAFQNEEKEKRAAELVLANRELHFQNQEKENRAAELAIANRELAFQNAEKEKRAAELALANVELVFQNKEKEKRAAELVVANQELAFQNKEKEKRAAELSAANDELKKAEQSIEFDRNSYESLINNTHDLMWSVDRDYKFITFNESFNNIMLRMSGRGASKGGDARVNPGLSEIKVDRYVSYYERAFKGEQFTEVEYTETPEEFWSEISFYPIFNGGEVVGTACFSRNITKRKKEEGQLKLLESVVTNTNDSIIILDTLPVAEGGPNIVYINDAFTKLTGYSKDEVLGKSPFFLLGPKSDQYEFDRLSECMRRSQPCEIEIIQYKKNREEIWVNLELVQIKNNEGTPTHYIAIQRDITAQINSVKSIREQNAKLKDIAWMQSHEVRGPLARILGLTNLMINHPHEEDRQKILDLLSISSVELDEIITKIVIKAQQVQ